MSPHIFEDSGIFTINEGVLQCQNIKKEDIEAVSEMSKITGDEPGDILLGYTSYNDYYVITPWEYVESELMDEDTPSSTRELFEQIHKFLSEEDFMKFVVSNYMYWNTSVSNDGKNIIVIH